MVSLGILGTILLYLTIAVNVIALISLANKSCMSYCAIMKIALGNCNREISLATNSDPFFAAL